MCYHCVVIVFFDLSKIIKDRRLVCVQRVSAAYHHIACICDLYHIAYTCHFLFRPSISLIDR